MSDDLRERDDLRAALTQMTLAYEWRCQMSDENAKERDELRALLREVLDAPAQTAGNPTHRFVYLPVALLERILAAGRSSHERPGAASAAHGGASGTSACASVGRTSDLGGA